MIFSDRTLTILKNFSTINQSLYFRQGNMLRTRSLQKTILAEAEIEENIPLDFGIYNLNEFLNGINSLYKKPELDFDEAPEYVLIKEGGSKSKYFYTKPKMIVYPEKAIQFPESTVELDIESSQFDKLIKASSIYNLPDFSIVGNGDVISLVVRNKNDDRTNYSIDVGNTDKEFTANFKIENLKIISDDYKIDLSDSFIARFKSKDIKYNLTYYVALENDSSF